MSHSPTIRFSHSSQIANAASAATDSTAMRMPTVEAVCHCAPVERPKSQGEKNRIMPRSKFPTSQSLALDQSSTETLP